MGCVVVRMMSHMVDTSGPGDPPSAHDARALLPIIRLAYEGIERRDAWTDMLSRVRELFRGHDATLVRMPLTQSSSPLYLSCGIDPDLLQQYAKYWAFPIHNPGLAAALEKGILGVVITNDIIPYDKMEKTEYFDVFRKPRGVRWEIGGADLFGPDSRRYITVNRTRRQPRFGTREIGLMRQMYPHVVGALHAEARIEVERRHYDSLRLAIESLTDAVLMIDCYGSLRPLNPAAERFLKQECLADRQPVAHQQPGSELDRVICDVLRFEQFLGGGGEPANGASLQRIITLPSGRRYRVDGSLRFDNGMVAAAVLQVRPAPDGLRLDGGALEQRWGLTPREIAVARGLAAGKSSTQLGRELAISRETLKTHLRHLFEKTQTRNRTELLAVLLRSATQF